MSSSTDIAAVYHEFTEALTEVLAENAVGVARRGRIARRTPPSRSIPTTASLDISWRSKWHSQIGKLYKTLVARTGASSNNVTQRNAPIMLVSVKRSQGMRLAPARIPAIECKTGKNQDDLAAMPQDIDRA